MLAGCSSEKESGPGSGRSGEETFRVIHPTLIDTVITNEYVADIHSLQNVEIRSRIKGFIEAIHVDEGKTVKEGQLLFTLNSRSFRDGLAKAKALLKSALAEAKAAEIDLKNAKDLSEKQVISASEAEMAQSRMDAALAHVEEARAEESAAGLSLSYTEIRAPFDGIINRIPNKAGSLMDEGALLTSISNNKEVLAYFNVSEKDYLDMKLKGDVQNLEVGLVLANGTIYSEKGQIETVEGEIDRATGNIAFRARFANPADLLKHGSNGKILVRQQLKAVLLIPQKSTFDVQDKTYAFVVDHNNTAHLRVILPRFRLPQVYVIGTGLRPDDRIIYEGIQHVKNGDRVKVELVQVQDMPAGKGGQP